MPERVPPSVRTGQRIDELLNDGAASGVDLRSSLIKLAVRRIVEEALEAEATDALGRGYYQRETQREGAAAEVEQASSGGSGGSGGGYRNGYRVGHLQSAEGAIDFA